MEETDAILDEISCSDIQKMMDQLLGGQSFSFNEYMSQLVAGKIPFSLEECLHTIMNGLAANLVQEKKMYVYLFLIAVIGAVFSNFTKLLQGQQIAKTAFYVAYMLFFSVLLTSFTQIEQIAEQTLTQLLDFIKVLAPAYFMTMTFSQGSAASGVYYEFTLAMITVVDYVLVHFALPAINVYFLLQIANQMSDKEIFSKMAELLRDIVKFMMKTMFGVMMGINVVQGMIVPIASQLENSAVIKVTGAIPGVGNTISNVAGTILTAGTLVKNAVGVTGVIVIVIYCGIPLLQLVVNKFLYQLTNALIQPVSDRKIVACLSAVTESLQLLINAVFTGCMMFAVSIALMSTMTSVGCR